jgi:hypothetical protein
MISSGKIENILDWMRDNAKDLGQSRANKISLEKFLKSKHAELFLAAPAGSVAYKEAWAYNHQDYRALLEGLKVAIEQESFLSQKFKTAEATIEVWRTMQANARIEAKVF